MTINANRSAKRAYSAPKLVAFGDMATLTKGGAGSITELAAGNNGSKLRS